MNIKQCIAILNQTDLFKALNQKELLSIFNQQYSIKEYEKNQIVHLQNEICNTIDVILQGCVVIQKSDENGNVLTVGEFSELNITGANLIFSTRNIYPMLVVANIKTTVVHMHKDIIMKLCQSNSDFMISLLKEVSDKVLVLTDKIGQISMKTIRMRIVEYLKYEQYIQKSNVIKLNTSKKNLAEKFGIQRSSLSRELNKMREDKMIEYDSRTITIISLNNRH